MYQQPKKMSTKKKIELAVLIFIAAWLALFAVNYVRYNDSKPLILAFHLTHKYDDGITEEYVSLGYVYRRYQRTSVMREELVPFWVLIENPKALPDLPVVETDYDVPENFRKQDRFRGLLYYFNVQGELLGTYKCVNSDGYCNKAFSGHDSYNLLGNDPVTFEQKPRTLGKIHEKYSFIDDSVVQDAKYGDANYSRIVYLYRFLDKSLDEEGRDHEILAKFADVKDSTFDENKNLGYGDDNKYIVKSLDNHLWGIVKITESGAVEEVLPYEYESISYDMDTGYYIVCKNKKWYVYDLEKDKTVSVVIDNPIYDVWENANKTEYIKVGIDRVVGSEEFTDFKVYRLDGKALLDGDKITAIFPRGKFLFYVTARDNYLRFMDYGRYELYKVKLNFWRIKHDTLTQPAFTIYNETENYLTLRIYDTRELSYKYDSKVINLKYWENND